jgi:hypothetical protein
VAVPEVSARRLAVIADDGNAEMNTNTPKQSSVKLLSYACVLISGIATAAVTLLLVYLANVYANINPMGVYLDYVLPVGAMIVGILAGSGYGLVSWIAGIKIPRALLWAVVFLQCVAYFCARYIVFENLHLVYKGTNQAVGFFEYFDASARAFAFKASDGGSENGMGPWGYVFRLLEVAGFAASGVLIPLFVSDIPYCDSCRRYMRRKSKVVLPGSVRLRKVKTSDASGLAAYQEEQRRAAESAEKAVNILGEMAGSRQIDALNNSLGALSPGTGAARQLPVRYLIHLFLCPTCPADN